jgi:hypothetical protein
MRLPGSSLQAFPCRQVLEHVLGMTRDFVGCSVATLSDFAMMILIVKSGRDTDSASSSPLVLIGNCRFENSGFILSVNLRFETSGLIHSFNLRFETSGLIHSFNLPFETSGVIHGLNLRFETSGLIHGLNLRFETSSLDLSVKGVFAQTVVLADRSWSARVEELHLRISQTS